MCVSLCPACGRETTPTPSTTAAQRQRQTQMHKLPNIQHKVPPWQLLHRHCKPRKLEEITANPGGAHVAMVMMTTMMMHHRPGSSLHTRTLFSLSLSLSPQHTLRVCPKPAFAFTAAPLRYLSLSLLLHHHLLLSAENCNTDLQSPSQAHPVLMMSQSNKEEELWSLGRQESFSSSHEILQKLPENKTHPSPTNHRETKK